MTITYNNRTVIDTHQLRTRLAELEELASKVDVCCNAYHEANCAYNALPGFTTGTIRERIQSIVDAARRELDCATSDLEAELATHPSELQDLRNAQKTIPTWSPCITLVPEDYLPEYCRQEAEDCGYISDRTPWFILKNINWRGVAIDSMREDYRQDIEICGVKYRYRDY